MINELFDYKVCRFLSTFLLYSLFHYASKENQHREQTYLVKSLRTIVHSLSEKVTNSPALRLNPC